MQKNEPEGRRYAGYGSEKGKEEAVENQRDPEQDVNHMPRHWQAPGTRGQSSTEGAPGVDDREVARGNQYGEAGEAASEQVHRSLDEHGEKPAPQQRENEQLPRRKGERSEDLPTPRPGDAK
jgi:hypothetical protein